MRRTWLGIIGLSCLSVLAGCGTKSPSPSAASPSTKASPAASVNASPSSSSEIVACNLFDLQALNAATGVTWQVVDNTRKSACTITASNGSTIAVVLSPTQGQNAAALAGAKSACDVGTMTPQTVVDGGYVCQIHQVPSAGALFSGDNVLVSISAVTANGQTPAQVQTALVSLLKSFAAPATPSTSPGTASGSGAITDAVAARDKLLAAAPTGSPINHGSIDAWQSALVGVQFRGSAVAADASDVSGFTFVTMKGNGLDALPFAVADSKGHCAGGLLESTGNNKVSKAAPVTLPAGAACTGDAVGKAAGF